MMQPKFTKAVAVISGERHEVTLYKREHMYGYRLQSKQRSSTSKIVGNDRRYAGNQRRSANYAKKQIFRLIDANSGKWFSTSGIQHTLKFLTLTYADNVTSLKQASKDIALFLRKVNVYLKKIGENRLKYVLVYENQIRGALHFHVILFNLPFTEKSLLESMWRHGFLHISAPKNKRDMNKVVAGYVSSSFSGNVKGKKRFYTSKGLKRSRIIRDEGEVLELLKTIPADTEIFESVSSYPFCGEVIRKEFRIEEKCGGSGFFKNN
jgi:hypothetical protein